MQTPQASVHGKSILTSHVLNSKKNILYILDIIYLAKVMPDIYSDPIYSSKLSSIDSSTKKQKGKQNFLSAASVH